VVTHSQKYLANFAASQFDLSVDLCADENGKAVHEDCYVDRITNSHHFSQRYDCFMDEEAS